MKPLSHLLTVSGATLISRVLGLVRDSVFFALFGTSAVGAAFLLAFTLPNLFRRLLGEGALASALIPSLAKAEAEAASASKGGGTTPRALLRSVLGWQLLALVCVTALGCALLALPSYVPAVSSALPEGSGWVAAAGYGWVLFPYVMLVCLAASLGAALNQQGRFALPALSPIILNVCMVAAMLLGGVLFSTSLSAAAYVLCAGVLVAGILQVLLPASALKWPRPSLQRSAALSRAFALFFPALLGASVFQLHLLVSRFLAFGLEPGALSIFYLASRLAELPIGVFAIALSTVLFPRLSMLGAQANSKGGAKGGRPSAAFGAVYRGGVLAGFSITLPAAAGLAALAGPMVALLFGWGRFTPADVANTLPVVWALAAGIPGYGMAQLATRAHHSLHNTKLPVNIGLCALVGNVAFALLLMPHFGVAGLAWASVLVTYAQCAALHATLRLPKLGNIFSAARTWLALVAATALLWAFAGLLSQRFLLHMAGDALAGAGRLAFGAALLGIIGVCAAVYFVLLRVLAPKLCARLWKLLRR